MAQELTEEMKVLITAEVDKAVQGMRKVDAQSKQTEKLFKTLGKTMAGVFAAKQVIAFARDSVAAYERQKSVLGVLAKTVETTGAAAWTSAGELKEMAESLQKVSNYGDDAIEGMQSVLLGFKNIRGDSFNEATQAILDMATVMKMDLSSAAQAVGKALDDPINGIDSLKRQGFNFTDSQKKMIKAMLDAGDAAGAQKVILDELKGTYGGAAKAAQSASTALAMAWGDLKENIGRGVSGAASPAMAALAKLLETINSLIDRSVDLADANKHIASGTAGMDDYRTKIEQANESIGYLEKSLEQIRKGERQAETWEIREIAEELELQRNLVREYNTRLGKLKLEAQERQKAIEAESAINELMSSIADEYERLGKDDPERQLEVYQKRLREIAAQRKKLAADTTGIDTGEAERQLDYVEKKIREKMDALRNGQKKSWKKWFSEITDVDEKAFTNGREGAEKYIDGLEQGIASSKDLSKALGKKFNMRDALESQRDEIARTLDELMKPGKDGVKFEVGDQSVDTLIAKYHELDEAIRNTRDENATLSEQFGADFAKMAQDLFQFTDEAIPAFEQLGESMFDATMNSAMSGFSAFGEALGQGADAAESLGQAMSQMAEQILNQLPMMFMQAGLQLIAQGNWPLGLGFIAAAGSTSIISGFVKGTKARAQGGAEANALGGVYGGEGYEAFALGGAFTNSVVTSPTYFKFARGGRFHTGLMGEAGPEAVMPLTRGADGSLGVSVHGQGQDGGGEIVINIYSNEKAEVQSGTDEKGRRQIDVTIGGYINSHISSGKADKVLSARYGIKARGL